MSDINCGTCKWYMPHPVQGRAGACGNVAATSDSTTENLCYDCAMPDGDCGGEFYEERADSVEQVAREAVCILVAIGDSAIARGDMATAQCALDWAKDFIERLEAFGIGE